MFHKSNKVIVMLKPPTNAIPGGSIGGLCFAFKSSGREKFIEEIQKLLISRPWEKVVKKAPAAITTAHAGVSGLLRRAEEKAKETDQALVEGFKGI
ncbi:hypothetical protein Pelo_19706 [Pelomyxa schiedti]|nr:hypothetical protein Pelo_19706 [Pelomyxa schiedti]